MSIDISPCSDSDTWVKVVCSITGHELPCNLNALECYVNSKKYKQFTKNGTCDLSKVEEFKEYLIPSKKGQNKLFCLITKKEINNIPSHIENHVTGRKFQRDLKIYKKKLEGVEESSDQGQSRSKFYNEEKPPTVAEEEEESDDAMMMEERIEKQDEEFLGGIWVPKGKITEDQVASCEESMDMDMKEEVERKLPVSESEGFAAEVGLPQAALLSPIFFDIVIIDQLTKQGREVPWWAAIREIGARAQVKCLKNFRRSRGAPLKTWLNFSLRKTRGLICGLEAVALDVTKRPERKLEIVEIIIIKWVTGITKLDRKRNEMVRKTFK
eukprot:gene10533-19261_t